MCFRSCPHFRSTDDFLFIPFIPFILFIPFLDEDLIRIDAAKLDEIRSSPGQSSNPQTSSRLTQLFIRSAPTRLLLGRLVFALAPLRRWFTAFLQVSAPGCSDLSLTEPAGVGRVTLHRWVDQHVLAAVVGTLGSPVGEEKERRERGVGVGDGGLQRERAPSGFQAQLLANAEDDAAPTQTPPRRRLMSVFR